jgi:aspartate racemase
VYSLHHDGAAPAAEPLSVATVARALARDLRGLQPQGPYYLAGWSFGGLVAFELAQSLRGDGQEVALLTLFDTEGPGYPAHRPWAERWRAWWRLRPGARLGRPAVNVWRWLRETQTSARRWCGRRVGVRNPWARVMCLERDYLAAARRYAGRIVLFPSTESLAAVARLGSRVVDPSLGWGAMADAGVEVQPIRGDHHTMFDEPGLSDIAAVLRAKLPADGAAPASTEATRIAGPPVVA